MALLEHAAERIHQVTNAFTNFFLVEDGPSGAVTVVDTGFPRSWSALHDALAQLKRRSADIEAIVLTHAHFDHMGFARRAQQQLGIQVLAHEREVPVVRHPWQYDHERRRIEYALRYPRFIGIFTAMGAQGALFVKGTDRVTTYGSDGELDVPGRPSIVFTPGHTHGHCALHFRDRGVVIAGDAIVTLDPYTGHSGPRIVSRAATANSVQALQSLSAIEESGAQTILTGHGDPWRQGAAAAVSRAREAGPS
jgi:glyoxylase-like metal-dependent hydrolase (beta-lactamase superfamily II)